MCRPLVGLIGRRRHSSWDADPKREGRHRRRAEGTSRRAGKDKLGRQPTPGTRLDEQALVISTFSTWAEGNRFIETWRITVFFTVCWPNLFSHLAAFKYNGPWFPSLHVSR